MVSAPTETRRVELILREIDALPTLPAVATRLLTMTTGDDSSAEQVTQLIESDASLTAKVLSMCRNAGRGVREVKTVQRAVVLLGFDAIRNIVLSVKVMEFFDEIEAANKPLDRRSVEDVDSEPAAKKLDRVGLWTHSLAVGILAQKIAQLHRDPQLPADEAFVCGLLHDIGKLGLDHALPKGYSRVCELAELHHRSLAEYERSVLGLDHHTAGKRLAEQWGLPQTLTDCIWLHGSPIDGLPDVPHRRLISLIRLADGLAREQHVGFSGNNVPLEDRQALVRDLGLDSAKVHEASLGLFEKLEELGQSFGIHDQPSEALSLAAMQKANRELSRLNQAHATKGKAAAIQKKLLDTITVFNALAEPGLSIADVLDHVATSAAVLLGEGELSVAYIGRQDDADHLQAGLSDRRDWLVHRYDAGGMPAGADYLKPPAEAADWVRSEAVSLHHQPVTQACPWLFDRVSDTVERPGRVIPLPCGWGNIALLIHHSPNDFDWQSVAPLAGVWGGAVAAAAQHEGAKRLGEQLAEANNALAEAQDLLLAKESLARLGEMAAGAAHEMNNPLSVISGRSQVLTLTLPDGSKERSAALAIFRESHRLSDLISCLHMFAEPPQAQRKTTDLTALLKRVIQRVQKSIEKQHPAYSLEMQAIDLPERVLIDEEQIDRAVTELLFNAVQASPKSKVVLNVRIQAGRQLIVQVIDDGRGMDTHTLQHAIDPFFSNKPAGRQLGMGLPRVQQLAKAHGGMVSLRSTPQRGTVATLSVPLDSPPQ